LAREDVTLVTTSSVTNFSSDYGNLGFGHHPVVGSNYGWSYSVKIPSHEYRGFQLDPTGGATSFWIPFWFPVVLSTALAVAPWLRKFGWRFQVRNLLITTTLLAVLLGLFAYLAR
jgi:hypothetical protein